MKKLMAFIFLSLLFSSCKNQMNVEFNELVKANASYGDESSSDNSVVETYGYRLDATDEEYATYSGYALQMDSTYLAATYTNDRCSKI